jgi:hypothetical protein
MVPAGTLLGGLRESPICSRGWGGVTQYLYKISQLPSVHQPPGSLHHRCPMLFSASDVRETLPSRTMVH